MNKKFAVGVINFFNNELIIEIVEGDNWQDALSKHSQIDEDLLDFLINNKKSLEEAKQAAFNCDMMIDIIEI